MKKKLLTVLVLCFLTFILILSVTSCAKKVKIDSANKDISLKDIEIGDCEHKFSEWEQLDAPTCTKEGKNARICSICKLIDVDYVSKTAHNASISQIIPPTCTAEGYSIYLCECGYTYKSDYVAPAGHRLQRTEIVAKTCATVGFTRYKCDYCNYSFDTDFIPQSHDFEISAVNPTVSQAGFTSHSCKNCSFHYDDSYIKYTDILPSPYLEDREPLYKGIDIYESEHEKDDNGNYLPIDWAAIKAQGYDFVILKVGSNYSGKSKTFDMDYEGAKAAGLMVGAYYYAYSSTVADTLDDAQEVLEWIKGKQFEFPIYYDIEEPSLAENLPKEALTELITAFIEELQKNGYYSALYVNANWLNNILDTEAILERFDVWYARYPGTEDPTWNKNKYGNLLSMWQYTNQGTVEGFDTDIDLNFCYRDYPSLMKKWGLNGFEKETA